MSDRPIIAPNIYKPIINAGDMSGNLTSQVLILQRLPGISFDIKWTGTPTGTFSVQVSNTVTLNSEGSISNAGNWTTLPSSAFTGTYPVPSGSADNGFLDIVGTEAYAVRVLYNFTGGSGSLTVTPCAKVF